MRGEARFFVPIGGFLAGASVVYAAWSRASGSHVEWVGTMALAGSAGLCAMCWLYFWLVSRRLVPRPEDNPDAEPHEGAGVVGFFSPGSYWPLGIGFGAFLLAWGAVFWKLWLVGLGTVVVLMTVSGLLFEYYTGSRREG